MQQDQPLCLKLGGDEIDAGRVPAGPIETGDEAIFDGVVAGREYDRNGRAGCLGCPGRGRAASKDHSYLSAHQFGCEGRQSTVPRARADRSYPARGPRLWPCIGPRVTCFSSLFLGVPSIRALPEEKAPASYKKTGLKVDRVRH